MELILRQDAVRMILDAKPGDEFTFMAYDGKGYGDNNPSDGNVIWLKDKKKKEKVHVIRFENDRTVFYADTDYKQVISKVDFFTKDFLNSLDYNSDIYIIRQNESGGPQVLENLFILVNFFVKNDYVIEFQTGSNTIWVYREPEEDEISDEETN